MRQIDLIVLHHSLTEDGKTVSWGAIRHHHLMNRGWRDIGYHLGIELVNNEYEALIGRPWTDPGSHAIGANRNSLGICVVGNFEIVDPRTIPLLWPFLLKTVSWVMEVFGISDVEAVRGHREVSANRTCPGKLFDLPAFRENLRSYRTNGPSTMLAKGPVSAKEIKL